MQIGSIKRLPEAVHRSMRSEVVICDLAKIVEELVCNSLESGATKVDISVGVASSYVRVVDNGAGISRSGLMLLGERHATSKSGNLDLMDSGTENYGFHGETLCSISNVSLLEILTRVHGKPNGYKKVIKESKCLFIGISDDRQAVGTTVTVRDIFYNQPVRRKHMESSSNKMLNAVKMAILRLALINMGVSFVLVDRDSVEKILHIEPSSSPSTILSRNFGIENSTSFLKLNLSSGELKLSGFISGPRDVLSVKAIQYVYINSRFIQKGPIHELLNDLAGKFDLFKTSLPIANSQGHKRIKYEFCPMFILNLCCPRSFYDIFTQEQARTFVEFKDWRPVLAFVGNGVEQLWTESKGAPEGAMKRCCTKNFETVLDLHSPKLKKVCREKEASNLEISVPVSAKPSRKVSKFEMCRRREDLLYDEHYMARLSDGFPHCPVKIDDEIGKNKISFQFYSPSMSGAHGENSANLSPSLGITSFDFEMDDKSLVGPEVASTSCSKWIACSDIDQDIDKSFLRSFSFERSLLYDPKSHPRDEHFLYGTDAFQIKGWIDYYDSRIKESDLMNLKKDESFDGVQTFQSSLLCEFTRPETSESSILGSISSYLRSDSEINDSDCRAASYIPLYSSFSGHSGLWKDFVDEYSNLGKNDDFESFSLSGTDWWQHQVCTISNSYQDKGKRLDENYWDVSENKIFPRPVERFLQAERTRLAPHGEETLKDSAKLLSDMIPTGQGYDGSDIKHGLSLGRRKKRSNRSFSAPPFHKMKKIFMDLPYSSIVSANSHAKHSFTENKKSQYTHKLFDQDKLSPLEIPSSRSSGPREISNDFSIQSDVLENTCQHIDSESVEGAKLTNLKGSKDAFDDACKLRSFSSTIREGGSTSDDSKPQDFILSSDVLHASDDCIVPNSIDRTSLQDAVVLNQVDKKFIAVVARNTLALIDQHAADERIRLEELRQKVLSGEMRRINYLDAEKELILPETGYQLLHNYAEQIQNWGWTCNIHSQDTSSFSGNFDFFQKHPTEVKLLSVPCVLDVDLTDIDLLEFLQQLADTDGSSTVPPSVLRILNNKACRGAIMFGDSLLPSECSLIVEELKRTSLCFQCAHGRPTTVPVVDLEALRKSIVKLSPDEAWHGLRPHRISLDRCEQRLNP